MALFQGLIQQTTTGEAQRMFNKEKQGRPQLEPFEQPGALIEYLKSEDEDRDHKDAIYAALVGWAQAEHQAGLATTLLSGSASGQGSTLSIIGTLNSTGTTQTSSSPSCGPPSSPLFSGPTWDVSAALRRPSFGTLNVPWSVEGWATWATRWPRTTTAAPVAPPTNVRMCPT
jgi:hypothetical protein